MRPCMPEASFTSGAESSSTRGRLCMLCDEDCRTAGFGKTERPVGWEGNGEPAMARLVRHCAWGNPLCANISETSRSSTITVGRGKKSHFDEHKQDKQFFRSVGDRKSTRLNSSHLGISYA